MSRQPDELYISLFGMICHLLHSRSLDVFGNMESEADFDTIIDLSHLELIQSAHILFNSALVDGSDLLQEHHG